MAEGHALGALAVRQQDYVKAAIARGEGAGWIVLREMLPNVAAPVIIEATIRVAISRHAVRHAVFLGLGAQPPASEWGLMVSERAASMHQAPWIIVARHSPSRHRDLLQSSG